MTTLVWIALRAMAHLRLVKFTLNQNNDLIFLAVTDQLNHAKFDLQTISELISETVSFLPFFSSTHVRVAFLDRS